MAIVNVGRGWLSYGLAWSRLTALYCNKYIFITCIILQTIVATDELFSSPVQY